MYRVSGKRGSAFPTTARDPTPRSRGEVYGKRTGTTERRKATLFAGYQVAWPFRQRSAAVDARSRVIATTAYRAAG